MKADEAAEMMDNDHERDVFKQRAAVAISIFAMVLAICGLGGSNAAKDAMMSNILAANYFSFYQAKNIRQTFYELAADEVELGTLQDAALPEEAKARLREKLARYKATAQRYESEPATGEGKKELIARAREQEVIRDVALRRDPYFDYGEALLQIAIVLISVSIIASLPWLAFFGGAVGLAGSLLTLNGFLLLVAVPGLG
jgi:hypothetical protein